MITKSLETYTLKMVEGVQMPESKKNPETGKFEKTGNTEQFYSYTFISDDEFMEKLVFMKSPNKIDLRKLEGKSGNLVIRSEYNDYDRKVKTSLEDFHVEDSKK